jgi:uncharacterized protein
MIDQIFNAIAQFVNRRPKVIIALLAVLMIVALYGMTLLVMETGDDTYMNRDSPLGEANKEYKDTFKADTIILVIETSEPLNPQILRYIDRLGSDLKKQSHVESVQSVADVLRAGNGGELPQSKEEINSLVSQIPASERPIVVPSNVLTLANIRLEKSLTDPTEQTVLNNVQQVIDRSDPPSGVSVSMSGDPPFTTQMKAELMSSMAVLIGAAMILMVITMGLLFSYVNHRFLPVLFVGLGLVTAMGLMGLAGLHLNLAVIGAFPVMIGLGIDYAIQFHARLDEESRKGSLEDAVTTTITKTGPAVMYAMLATSLGFCAMFVSTVPMIRSFGLVAMIGIMSCYGVSLFGIPAIARVINYTPKPATPKVCYAVGENACGATPLPDKKKWSYGQFLTDTSVKIAKNPIPILLVVGVIALIGFEIDSTIPVQADQNTFVPPDMPAKIQYDKVTRILGSTTTADFYIQGARVTDLDTIRWMKEFQDHELATYPQLTSATSIVNYVLAYNNGVMPETQNQLDDVLARIPRSVKDQYISGSTRGLVSFYMVHLQIPEENDLKKQMLNDITFLQVPQGITLQPVGSFSVYTTIVATLTESKDMMTYLGFGLILVFLILVYRHFHAVSPLIPIVMVVGCNSVAMQLLGIDYTPLTATLGSMTIGVAAEYTILVMERYTEEEERLHNHIEAIQESVQKIGSAITVSGLATFLGFSALCLSTFPITANFGISTLIAVGFSLLGAIFVMPAVLSLMGSFTAWWNTRRNHGSHHGIPDAQKDR